MAPMRDVARAARILGGTAVLCALTVLAGCGGATTPSPTPAVSSSSSPSAPPSPSATTSASAASPSPSAASPILPAGTQLITSAGAGLSLAAPKDWAALDRSLLEKPDVMAEMTTKTGMSKEQLTSLFTNIDVLVMGSPKNGYAPNLNIFVVPRAKALPTDSEIRAQIGKIGEISDIREQSTALGLVRVVTYTATSGSASFSAQQLYVIAPAGGVAVITIGAADGDAAASLTSTVLSTLADAS